MIPKRPFLLRAFYDWILENNMTPHIVVDTTAEEVSVPKQHIKDGKIVLNVSPTAVQDFMMDNEALSFSARFGGVAFYIYCPMYAIETIYARESPTDGISFSPDEYADVVAAEQKPAKVARLSAVGSDSAAATAETEQAADVAEAKASSDAESGDQATDDGDDGETPPPRKRPSLRVVK